MNERAEKLRLADRAEAILRNDRQAIRSRHRDGQEPALLLTLVPNQGAVIDLMDAYIPDIAETAGLQYVRLVGTGLREVPRHYLCRTFLVLADLTGRDEDVITLVYQTLGGGRRILISAQHVEEIPRDLESIPSVLYHLEQRRFDQFLREIQRRATSTLHDTAIIG